MISRTNIVLAVLLGVVVLLAGVSGVDYSRPNVEILADTSMKYTPASTSYESNEVFANKMTQQEPIPGTLARGEMPLYFAPLPPDVDLKTVAPKDSVPGNELVNPVSLAALLDLVRSEQARDEASTTEDLDSATPPKAAPDITATDSNGTDPKADAGKPADAETKESVETVANRRFQASISRGSDVYLAFCVCCHGPAGKGDGMVAQRGYPPPPSYLIGTVNEWNDGQLFHILTYGRANMPQFAAELPRQSRWDVINYVRTLQETLKLSATDQQVDAAPMPDTEETLRTPSEEETSQEAEPSITPAEDARAKSDSQQTTKQPAN